MAATLNLLNRIHGPNIIIVPSTKLSLIKLISIFHYFGQPFDSNETGMVILHESFTSPFGSYLVYAPMDTALMNVAISGEEDLTLLEILPCGFVVSPICPSNEGNNNNNNTSGAGSLLTLAYQIFVADHYEENVNNLLNAQNVDTIVSLLTTTLKSVKDGLVN